MGTTDWRDHGVNVIPADTLDPNTAQTPGMTRAAAINLARVGAQKILAGTVSLEPNAKTGAHHHGHLESVIYVVKGRARMRGANGWSSSPRPGPATSSTFRRSFRTRRSMQAGANASSASWFEVTTKQSPSTSTSPPSKNPKPSIGSTLPIRIPTHRYAGRDAAMGLARVVSVRQPLRRNRLLPCALRRRRRRPPHFPYCTELQRGRFSPNELLHILHRGGCGR